MNRKVLITGATGDAGRVAVKESIALGLIVRAMVHGKDRRSTALEKLGAEVMVDDLHNINSIRAAMEGIDGAEDLMNGSTIWVGCTAWVKSHVPPTSRCFDRNGRVACVRCSFP